MPATTKDHNSENQNNSSDNGSKISTTTTKAAEQGLKCPRCDSPNTKFCYYNNYSLTQPRHFCKTCRRYWTKGGALRNVPIGGGCRKNKKGMKPPSSSSSSSSRALSYGDSRDSGGSTSHDILQLGGLTKLLNGLSNNPLDFNLGGLSFPASSSRLQQPQQFHLPIATGFYDYGNNNTNQFCSFGDASAASSSSGGFHLDPCSVIGGSSSNNLISLNFPPAFPSAASSSSGSGLFGSALQQGLNSLNFHSSTLASSIESLSSLNQDLHWKLQQQRLGMLYGGDNQNQKEDNNNINNNINNSVLFSAMNNNNNNNNVINTLENQAVVVQRPQPILFQSLEISKALPSSSEIDNVVGGGGGDSSCCRRELGRISDSSSTTTAPTEWFFGNNSYGSVVAPNPTSSSRGGGANNNGHDSNAGRSNSWVGVGGVHAWGDVQQPYTALP